jgi:hypothetical protein
MDAPPKKKALPKLPPKGIRGQKIIQEAVPDKVYTLNTSRHKRGEKIILYGASGMGKTTMGTLAPKPVFVSADDGVDRVVNPVTGEDVPSYTARTYEDVRGILSQPKLFEGFETIVLDNMTEVENLAVPFILQTMTKDGRNVTSLEGFGWGSGYAHLADHDNYVKYDLQRLADAGFNVIVICQLAPRKETSAEVPDYLKDGPKLVYRPGSKAFAATDFVEWSDHCFRLGYSNLKVSNKRATSSGERVIFVHPETHFDAKSRVIPSRFPLVSFSDPTDDSIWKFVFDKAWPDEEETE